jgi:hypothetical protein
MDMRALMKKYRPEIVAAVGLIIYTIIRTVLVAQGISPVSGASWEIFLFIEIITTAPYVWAVGNIVRHSLAKQKKSVVRSAIAKRLFVFATAALSFVAPYLYLMLYGALETAQGATVFLCQN